VKGQLRQSRLVQDDVRLRLERCIKEEAALRGNWGRPGRGLEGSWCAMRCWPRGSGRSRLPWRPSGVASVCRPLPGGCP